MHKRYVIWDIGPSSSANDNNQSYWMRGWWRDTAYKDARRPIYSWAPVESCSLIRLLWCTGMTKWDSTGSGGLNSIARLIDKPAMVYRAWISIRACHRASGISQILLYPSDQTDCNAYQFKCVFLAPIKNVIFSLESLNSVSRSDSVRPVVGNQLK